MKQPRLFPESVVSNHVLYSNYKVSKIQAAMYTESSVFDEHPVKIDLRGGALIKGYNKKRRVVFIQRILEIIAVASCDANSCTSLYTAVEIRDSTQF